VFYIINSIFYLKMQQN